MRLIFLGTSSGAPTRARNVSALAFGPADSRRWYLVDCGEATQHQLMHTPLSTAQLGGICITHVHGDHCFGLPGLLSSAAISGRREPLTIIGPAGIDTLVRTTLEVSRTELPYEIRFVPVETLPRVEFEDFTVEAYPLSHRVPSFAYRFTQAVRTRRVDAEALAAAGVPRGPAWSSIQRGEAVRLDDGRILQGEDFLLPAEQPRRLLVAGDNDTPELLREACQQTDVLVHEATYTHDLLDERRARWQHSSALQVARFAEDVGLPNLVLTHFSARFQRDPTARTSIENVRREATGAYSGRLFLADDLAAYHLDRAGRLRRAGD